MRQFAITVNGVSYQVSVEELGVNTPAPAVSAPVAFAPPAFAPAPAAAPAGPKPVAVSGGHKIIAPMPGVILEVRVKEGAAVKNGDILLMLEAMKMENEILAPANGVVKQVLVSKGATVNTDDIMIVLE